jgi:two-component system, OmpR family, response regulator
MMRGRRVTSSSFPRPRDAEEPVGVDRVLVIDDDHRLREMVAEYLTKEGFRVAQADSTKGARKILEADHIDLILVDLVLGNERGLDLVSEVRQHSPTIGVIIMTGRSDVIDRIIGLELGADDYIIKPFELREVVARIRSLLRRLRQFEERRADYSAEDVIRFEGWSLDLLRRRLTDPDRREVALTTSEFALLAIFAKRPGHVLDRDRLLNLTKGRGWSGFDRTIDAHVARLRKKIERDPANPTFIKSVRGSGYLFAARVD